MLNKYNVKIEDISGFSILSKTFKNPHNVKDNGFDFLNIYHCTQICQDLRKICNAQYYYTGQKIFINPRNTKMIQVHFVLDSISPLYLSKDDCYINHYKFLNKLRDRDSYEKLFIDDSISRFNKF